MRKLTKRYYRISPLSPNPFSFFPACTHFKARLYLPLHIATILPWLLLCLSFGQCAERASTSTSYTLLIRRVSYSTSHATSMPWIVAVQPPPLSPWRPNGLIEQICVGEPGARSRPATSVVFQIIWKTRSLQTSILDKDPPSVSPPTLAAGWSMSSLPFFSRCPKLSHIGQIAI